MYSFQICFPLEFLKLYIVSYYCYNVTHSAESSQLYISQMFTFSRPFLINEMKGVYTRYTFRMS